MLRPTLSILSVLLTLTDMLECMDLEIGWWEGAEARPEPINIYSATHRSSRRKPSLMGICQFNARMAASAGILWNHDAGRPGGLAFSSSNSSSSLFSIS